MRRSLFTVLLITALAACAEPPAPASPEPPSPREGCKSPSENPAADVDRWSATALDPGAVPAARAEAVKQIACLASATKASEGRVIAGLLTLGLSELFLHGSSLFEKSVVPESSGRAVLDALSGAYCDPIDKIHAAARLGLTIQSNSIAAVVLSRSLACSADARAFAAVEDIEERASKAIWMGEHSVNWQGYELFASALQQGSSNARPAVAARISAARTKLGQALDEWVGKMASSSDVEVLTVSERDTRVLELLPALQRGAPAFRARLADPNPAIRIAAGRTLVTIKAEDASVLAQRLWTGLPAPASTRDPQAAVTLRNLLAQPALDQRKVRDELLRLARQGRSSEPALQQIRACFARPEQDIKIAAAIALVFVAGDRSVLPTLRATYEPFFADSPSAYGGPTGPGEEIAFAILSLEPEDAHARRALKLGQGPLLPIVTARVLMGHNDEWLITALRRDAENKTR